MASTEVPESLISSHGKDYYDFVCSFIKANPLGKSLHHLKKPLRKAIKRSKDAESKRRTSIYLLLSALALKVMESDRGVSAAILRLTASFVQDVYKYGDYRFLIELILNDESDAKVWMAVFDIIHSASITRDTNKGTRVTFCTAFLQGPDQKKATLNYQLLEELRPWTYRDVGGFIEKYFDDSTWNSSAQDIFCKIKNSEYKDGKWKDFTKSPGENEFWGWWQKFQENFLSDSRRHYYHTEKAGELNGGERPCQLDLFVAPTNKSADSQHEWTSVMVVGELKRANHNFAKSFVQLATYVRDVFSAQPSRRFVHAFTLCGSTMEAWVFDRSGGYSSGPFDIHKKAEQFIQVIAGYCLMSEEQLGVDTFMKQSGDQCSISFEKREAHGCITNTPAVESGSRTNGEELGRDALEKLEDGAASMAPRECDSASSLTKVTMVVDPNFLFRQRAIVSRGTVCYATKVPAGNGYDDCVTKFSWVSKLRRSEADLHKLVLERNVQGVVKLVAHRDLTSIEELRSGLNFGKRYGFSPLYTQAGQCYDSDKWERLGLVSSECSMSKRWRASISQANTSDASRNQNETTKASGFFVPERGLYDNRILRCLVLSPAGKPLYQYESPLELVEAMRDAIRAHKSLYQEGGILHRDISENNIIITDANSNVDGFRGMLIDLDLAKQVGDDASGSHHCTGTMAFMAIETLRNRSHTYRHDLESFFYVLVWQCARRGWDYATRQATKERKAPERSLLECWYNGTFEATANNKEQHLHAGIFEDVLKEFPSCLEVVKQLCRDFRRVLFRTDVLTPYLSIETPDDSEKLYGDILEAFENNINNMN